MHARKTQTLAAALCALVLACSLGACSKATDEAAEPESTDDAIEQLEETDEQAEPEQAADEEVPQLDTQVIMTSLTSLNDKLTAGELSLNEDELAAIPDYEGDDLHAKEDTAITEDAGLTSSKAPSGQQLWYTTGVAFLAPDHWQATLTSDEIDFVGTKYELEAIVWSCDKSQVNISATDAADIYLSNISSQGYYNIELVGKGGFNMDGKPRGSYVQFVADYDWKGVTSRIYFDVNYIEGKTKMNCLGFFTPLNSYAAAIDDIDNTWSSVCYVTGEAF